MQKKGPLYNKDTPFGAAYVIEDGITGFVVPVGDVNGLGGKIITLLNDPEPKEKCSRNAFELVIRKFSIQGIVRQFERCCKEMYNGCAKQS